MVSGDRSNKIAITFKGDRCLYSRSTWTSCSLCVDSCPGKAIQMAKERSLPEVDFSRCMQCGQCLSACPLEAFESSSFSERQLFNRIDSGSAIRLHCFLPHGEYASLGSGLTTYHLGTCLAALTPGALFELSVARRCELNTDQCQQCALFPKLAKTLECNLTTAYLLLLDWGCSENLIETSTLFLLETAQDKTSHGEVSSTEVRSFDDSASYTLDGVELMRSSIRSLFHGRKKKDQAKRSQIPLRAKKRRVPIWRLRLKEHWDNRSYVSNDAVCPWPVLVVDDDRCKACGICMQLCPTGSIRHALGDGSFAYSFIPGTCVNCGLCIASCSSGALSREYRSVETPFEALECSLRNAHACARCGLPVLEAAGTTHCFLCMNEPDPRNLADRVRKQMAAMDRSGPNTQRQA